MGMGVKQTGGVGGSGSTVETDIQSATGKLCCNSCACVDCCLQAAPPQALLLHHAMLLATTALPQHTAAPATLPAFQATA
jgi:hypothetical protein